MTTDTDMLTSLTELLRATAAQPTSADRTAAVRAAIAACRALEEALQAALSQEPLRGLPNLRYSSHDKPFHALRVRSTAPRLVDGVLGARTELCLDVHGQLTMANFEAAVPAENWQLHASDVADLARTMVRALELHLAASERTSSRYKTQRDLSQRILATLGEG